MIVTVAPAAPAARVVRIVRIVAVRDTRTYIEQGDRWIPVPGTGNLRPCDRCARTHEIHVDVELADGTTSVIGLGCAKHESMAVQDRIKSAASAARTCARLAAELARLNATARAAVRTWEEVGALPLPAITRDADVDLTDGGVAQVYRMGDAIVWVPPRRTFDHERETCLANAWRVCRFQERGYDRYVFTYVNDACELERRLIRATLRLAKLTGPQHGAVS